MCVAIRELNSGIYGAHGMLCDTVVAGRSIGGSLHAAYGSEGLGFESLRARSESITRNPLYAGGFFMSLAEQDRDPQCWTVRLVGLRAHCVPIARRRVFATTAALASAAAVASSGSTEV